MTDTCNVRGCEQPQHTQGYCAAHYDCWTRYCVMSSRTSRNQIRTCTIDGCDRPVRALGLCATHYQRNLRFGDPYATMPIGAMRPRQTVCSIDGCGRRYHAGGFCVTHYQRNRTHGDPRADIPIGAMPRLTQYTTPPTRPDDYTAEDVTRWFMAGARLPVERVTALHRAQESRWSAGDAERDRLLGMRLDNVPLAAD